MLDVYGQLAEPSRRLILSELRTGPKSVSELVERTGLKQPNVSNHLAKMRARGIVRSNKVGRLVYYVLSTPDVHAAVVAVFGNSLPDLSTANLDALADDFAKHCMAGDEASCCNIVDVAMRAGAQLLDLFADLIGAGLDRVSDMWDSGLIDISENRIAVATAERALARIAQITPPRRRLTEVAVLGCAEGSWYTARVRMLGEYLRAEGWHTLLLGPNAPEEAFVAATIRHKPRIVIVGCGEPDSEANAARIADRLAQVDGNHCVGVAGPQRDSALQSDENIAFRARDLRDFAERCLPSIAPSMFEAAAD